jgi:phosphoenolpyruvate carboxykinase (ATP)
MTLATLKADLPALGRLKPDQMYRNLPVATLVELALARGEVTLTNSGALVATTGKHTGRSPRDKFFVNHPGSTSAKHIWWGKHNQPIDPVHVERLWGRLAGYLHNCDLFVLDAWAGAHPQARLPLRVITEFAWHSLFARQLFRRTTPAEQAVHGPALTIIAVPSFHADPAHEGTNSETAIVLDLERNVVLICGTHYAGEIKKSVFGVLNYLLPQQRIFPMHCSANVGSDGDVALFFGLSGTGKTTLSADPDRSLIGDDEHGWAEDGVFNFEGGCYAKTIRLCREHEPQIWNAIRFGAVVENVVVDPVTREPDYDDDRLTENTRAAYPIEHIAGAVLDGRGTHPHTIFFLTADAFGVLPPISQLTADQAMYHFLSGYTAKLAGTEAGLGTKPQLTFSACFGAPFLPLPPITYAQMLGDKMTRHRTRVFLVNTGWSGGPAGVGQRIKLQHTRAMVHAAIMGELDKMPTWTEPVFGLHVPVHIEGVPDEALKPRDLWPDTAAYDRNLHELARRFIDNFRQFDQVSAHIRAAGPRL